MKLHYVAALASLNQISSAATSRLLYSDNATWIENMDVRRSNGYILPATASQGVLYQVDPASGRHELVHNFTASGNAIMSICEAGFDKFLLNTMTCDMFKLECTPGSGITWLVDFNTPKTYSQIAPPAKITRLATGPSPASLLNGVAPLNPTTVLMVDQNLAGIWSINTHHGGANLVITDPTMNDTSSQGNGVNGIRVRPGTLYFNNPSKGTLYSMPIDPVTGAKRGEPKVIASGLAPDDFEVDEEKGFVYIVDAGKNALLKIGIEDGRMETVVEGLLGPTTARWKEYGRSLYVATSGGYEQWMQGKPVVPGTVYLVEGL